MGEGINFAQYTVARSKEGKNRLARIGLVCAYVLFAAAYSFAFIALRLPQVIAVLPILVWIFVYFSWGLVSFDYEYKAEGGSFYISRIRGKKTKLLVSFRIRDAIEIRPLGKMPKDSFGCRVRDLRGSVASPDSYCAVYEKNGVRECVCFELTGAMLKVLHRLNEKTVISEDLRF